MKVTPATRLLHLLLGHLLLGHLFLLRFCWASRAPLRQRQRQEIQQWDFTQRLAEAPPPMNLEKARLEVKRMDEEVVEKELVDPGGGGVMRVHGHEHYDVTPLPQVVFFSPVAGSSARGAYDPVTGRHRKLWTVIPARDTSPSPAEDLFVEEEEQMAEGRTGDKDKEREAIASDIAVSISHEEVSDITSMSAENTLRDNEVIYSRRRGGGEGGGPNWKEMTLMPRKMPNYSRSSPETLVRVPANWEYLYRPSDLWEETGEDEEVEDESEDKSPLETGAEDVESQLLRKGNIWPKKTASEEERSSSSKKDNQRGVIFFTIIPDGDRKSGRVRVKLRKGFRGSAADENENLGQDPSSSTNVQLTGKGESQGGVIKDGGREGSRGRGAGGRVGGGSETGGRKTEGGSGEGRKGEGKSPELFSFEENRSLRGNLLQRRMGEASVEKTQSAANEEKVEGRTREELADEEVYLDQVRVQRKSSFPAKERGHGATGYQYHYQDPTKGSYEFGYDTGTSRRHEERRPDGAVIGSYSWTDALGQLHVTNYVADALGYRVVKPGQQISLHVTSPSPIGTSFNDSSSAPGEYPSGLSDLLPAPTIPDKFSPSPPATGRPAIAHPLPGSSVSNGQGPWVLVGSTPSTVPRPPPAKPMKPFRPRPPFVSPFPSRPPHGQKPVHPTSIQDIIGNSPDPLKPLPEGGGFPLIPFPLPPVRPVLGVHGTLHGPNSTHLPEVVPPLSSGSMNEGAEGNPNQTSPSSGHRPDPPRPPPYFPWLPGQWIGSGQHQTGSSPQTSSGPGGPFQHWGPFPQHPHIDLEKFPILGLMQILNNFGFGTKTPQSSQQQQSQNHTEGTTTISPPRPGSVSSTKPPFRPWLGNIFKVPPPPPPPPPAGWPTRRPFRPKPIPPHFRLPRPRPQPRPLRPLMPRPGGPTRPPKIPAERPQVSLDYAFLESGDPEEDFKDQEAGEEQPENEADESNGEAGAALTSLQKVFQGLMNEFSNSKKNKGPPTNKVPEELQPPKPGISLHRRPGQSPGYETSGDHSGPGNPPQTTEHGNLDGLFSNSFLDLQGVNGDVLRPAWSYFSTKAPTPAPSSRTNTSSTSSSTRITTTRPTTTTTITSTTTTAATRPTKSPNTQGLLSAILSALYKQPKDERPARLDTLQ